MNDNLITFKLSDDYNIYEDIIQQIKVVLKEFIELIITKLNLNLEKIFITDNIVNDVREFQNSKGLIVEISDNCVGKHIYYKENDEMKCVIFYSTRVFNILGPNYNDAVSTIIHEMFHAYEKKESSKIYDINYFNLENLIPNISILDFNIKNICNVLWEEYYAIRRTSQTLKLYTYDLETIQFFVDTIDININIIMNNIIYYIQNVNRDKYYFLARLYENTCEALKAYIYIFGNIEYPLECDLEIINKLKVYRNQNLYQKLFQEMDRLINIYPDWCGIDEFKNLKNIIIEFWNDLGIFVEQYDKEISLHINTI